MVSALPTVNGLAAEILLFLKKVDAKQFAGWILSGELKEARSLRWGPIEQATEGIFGRRDADDGR